MKVTSLTVIGILLSFGMMSAADKTPPYQVKSLVPVIQKLEEHKRKLLLAQENAATTIQDYKNRIARAQEDAKMAKDMELAVDWIKDGFVGEIADSETEAGFIKRIETEYHSFKITLSPPPMEIVQPEVLACKAFIDNLPDVDYQTPHDELEAAVACKIRAVQDAIARKNI